MTAFYFLAGALIPYPQFEKSCIQPLTDRLDDLLFRIANTKRHALSRHHFEPYSVIHYSGKIREYFSLLAKQVKLQKNHCSRFLQYDPA